MILTEAEKVTGLVGHRLEDAVNSIRQDGYVVLEQCLDLDYVQQMKHKLLDVFKNKQQRLQLHPAQEYSLIDYPGVGGNHGFNRWNLRLPSDAPFLDNRLLGNPSAHAIFNAFFGDQPIYNIIACDMNLPRSTFQELHRDRSTFALIMNVPLVDMTLQNGATQIFPGTHRMPGQVFNDSGPMPYCPGWPPKSWKGKFLCVPAGSVIIRDVRMAHRGMVNATDQPRPLININVCKLEHKTVPYHQIINKFEQMGRRMRSNALSQNDAVSLRYWNRLGQVLCHKAKTDRFDTRRIQKEDWQRLNGDAQRLLRYAQIKDVNTEAYLAERSLKHITLISEILYGGFKVKQNKQISNQDNLIGLVKPSEPRLIEALLRNDHNEEDEMIILAAMKARGLNI